MTIKLAERIEDLEERLRQLKTRQLKSETRRRGIESRRTRREDTRRKILLGAIVLAKIDQGALEKAVVLSWLDQALTRVDDRTLFGLSSKTAVSR